MSSRRDLLNAPLENLRRPRVRTRETPPVLFDADVQENPIERILRMYTDNKTVTDPKRKRDSDRPEVDPDFDHDDKKRRGGDTEFSEDSQTDLSNLPPIEKKKKRRYGDLDFVQESTDDDSVLAQILKKNKVQEASKQRTLPSAPPLFEERTLAVTKPTSKRKFSSDDDDNDSYTSTVRVDVQISKRKKDLLTHKRQPNMLSMQNFMLDLLKADADEEADKLRTTRVHLRWEYEVLNLRFKGESIGDIRIKRRSEALEVIYIDMPPSKQQRLMHLGGEALSYVSYFGEELNAHMVRILREKKWSEFRTEGVFTAPRRFGKTVAEAMEAAAEIVTQPGNNSGENGHDVLVYSNNHRASKMLLLQTYKFIKILCANPKFGGKIDGINKNESIVFITQQGYVNTMYAYPAKPDNLRGTGSKCPTGTVIAEEFAYMPEEVFFGILAPTLTRRNVKFIGITTVNGSDSFVSPLTTAKYPDGRSVFLVLDFQLICAECKAARRQAQCKCLLGDLPHWQSEGQHAKLSIIMEKKIGKFLQEIKGLAIDETVSPAFCQVSCEFLRTPESIMKVRELYSDTVFCAVDPACGGKYSKFAIVSAIFRDNLMIIVGADLCKSERPETQVDKLILHVQAIRRIPGLQTAKVVFCPESNLGNEGKRIAQDLSRAQIKNCYCLMEDVRGNEGMRMTEELKKEMYLSTNALLLYRRIRWHQLMASVSDDEKFSAPAMRKLLIDELAGYQRQLVYSKLDALAPPKERFTGKIAGAGDDHCIALQIVYKSMEAWKSKPEFYSKLKSLDKMP